jgi:hypothetical protein
LADSPSNTINTSFIERSNGPWRLWDAHLARKSPLFAKSIRWLKAKLAICVATYNFIRPHGALSGKKVSENRQLRPWPPSWLIGLGNTATFYGSRPFVNPTLTPPKNARSGVFLDG